MNVLYFTFNVVYYLQIKYFIIKGQGNIEVTLSTESWSEPQKVCNELDSRGQILNIDGGKIVLSIPYSHELPDSLDKMELKKKEFGVTGMSVSLITLEQVFLKYVQIFKK
jgi:ATP-binding cassette subfamily A (ABC1) protein 3